jgi:glycogen synthase
MRILIISNFYPPVELGGWEQLTSNVAGKLVDRGHDVYVLTSNYRANEVKQPEPRVKRILYLESEDPVHYHPHYTLIHRWQEQKNGSNLKQVVAEFKPEIIYINGMWNLPYTVAKAAEQLLPGRVAYYLASYWPTEKDAHSAYWLDLDTDSWRRIPKQLMGSIAQKTLISATPRNRLDFRMVLCVSRFVQDYIVNEAGVPRERTRVVHNGIELDLFSFTHRQSKNGSARLLCAGRLSPDKGTHTVIESLARLRDEFKDVQVQLSIFGTGTPEYETHLRSQVTEAHLEDWVQFCGLVPREQMPAVFAEHDILLFPSIWSEPLARIVQEAMACGLVVIGTDTGGTNEILIDGENGLTFEAGNASSLAAKIAQVVRDSRMRASLARSARKTVEERFTLDRMVDEILDSFQQISKPPEFAVE